MRKKFVELAEKRVNNTIKQINLIGNLSNRSNYSYTDEDVKKIQRALKKALDDMSARFNNNGDESEKRFKL